MGKKYTTASEIKNLPGANKTGTARIEVSPDGRLLNIKNTFTKDGALMTLAEMREAIKETRLILTGGALKNPETVRACSAAEYFAILESNGWLNEDGLYPQLLAEPFRATVMDEEMMSLEMRRYGKVTFEYDITNDANPLDIHCDVELADDIKTMKNASGETVQVTGIISHTRQTEDIGGGTPIITLDDFNGPLNRIYLFSPNTTVISRIRVLRGDDAIYDRWSTATRPGLKQQLKDMGMVIPAAYTVGGETFNVWPIVFDNNQQLRNSVNGNGLRLEITNTAGGQIRMIRETQLAR